MTSTTPRLGVAIEFTWTAGMHPLGRMGQREWEMLIILFQKGDWWIW